MKYREIADGIFLDRPNRFIAHVEVSGAVEHPMVDVHHIQWIFVETENGGQIRYLNPGQAPSAVFELGGEKPVAVYAYCNLHGLWMTKL